LQHHGVTDQDGANLAAYGPNATMLALVTATAASSAGTREYLESFVTTTGNSVLLSQRDTGLYAALHQTVKAANRTLVC
jgi:hypothetical protein